MRGIEGMNFNISFLIVRKSISIFLLFIIIINSRIGLANDEARLLAICAERGVDVVHVNNSRQLINVSNGGIFCVHAGNYRSFGKLHLRSKFQNDEKINALIFFSDDLALAKKHPLNRAHSQQAIIAGLDLNNASNWLISGISIKAKKSKSRRPLITLGRRGVSVNNTLSQLLIEGSGGGAGQILIGSGSEKTTIKNSVIRRTNIYPKKDVHCIKINGGVGTLIEKNEIYDCAGDAIQVDGEGAKGGRIVGNDIYLTSSLYTNCKGKHVKNGLCACAENAIDLKAGGKKGTGALGDSLQIVNNRIWGFRKTDARCGGTGDAGNAIVIHWEPADYVYIKGNLITNSDRGINVTHFNKRKSTDGTENVSIVENIFYNISGRRQVRGKALVLSKSSRYEVYGNIFIKTDEFLGMGRKPGSFNEFACNLIVNSKGSRGKWSLGSKSYNNVYLNSKPNWRGVNRLVVPLSSVPLFSNTFSFGITKTGSKKFNLSVPTKELLSKVENHCSEKTIDLQKGVGINDIPYVLNSELVWHELYKGLGLKE